MLPFTIPAAMLVVSSLGLSLASPWSYIICIVCGVTPVAIEEAAARVRRRRARANGGKP